MRIPELEKFLHRVRAPNPLLIFLEQEQLFGDWFDFGNCKQFINQVFQWLHIRNSEQRAPIQFYIDSKFRESSRLVLPRLGYHS